MSAQHAPTHQQPMKTSKRNYDKSVDSCHEMFLDVLGINRVATKFFQKFSNFEEQQKSKTNQE